MRYFIVSLITILCLLPGSLLAQPDTLPALSDDAIPSNPAELWSNFDPRAEELETEVLCEWEREGVQLQVVRFRIAQFKGKVAKLAAIFGYPKSLAKGQRLPGLLQIHGGGQYADQRAVIANAKRGYATVSIAWAGRISAEPYRVNPEVVKLFWEQKTADPKYKLTTDWGGVDGYHAPSRNPKNTFPSAAAHPWTIDKVESPRNSPWFLCSLAARRALTFLEQQSQVDPQRLGVYGHSMGGKLTVLTASDPRIKAAVPSCGGISDRDNRSKLFRKTIGDDPNLKRISCPILFLSPANDFHGRIGDLPAAIEEIRSEDWRVVCCPHYSHRDTGEFMAAGLLWFDQHLKQGFQMPASPTSELSFEGEERLATLKVVPDPTRKLKSIEVYYTQHGRTPEPSSDRRNTKSRYWRYVAPVSKGDGSWSATLPLASIDRPLWAYANVEYQLENSVAGAGYYYEPYETETVKLSSLLVKCPAKKLRAESCQATVSRSRVIEDFQGQWEKNWYHPQPGKWPIATHKVYDSTYAAPQDANALCVEVAVEQANTLLVQLDERVAECKLKATPDWQTIRLSVDDFQDATGGLGAVFSDITTFVFADQVRLRSADRSTTKSFGEAWKGPRPRFRNLRWERKGEPASDGKGVGSQDGLKYPARVSVQEPEVDRAMLDVFPASEFEANVKQCGETEFSNVFSPTDSVWTEGLDERKVFLGELNHRQNPKRDFQLRIGQGGQIYSLRGPFGESVPPSWRAPGAIRSPWNDEVWQFVAVCGKYNGFDRARRAGEIPTEVTDRLKDSGYADGFFVHNSGAYIPGEESFESLYCPRFAEGYDAKQRSYRVLNWGLVPQIKSINRSPILYYTQVRDVGNGVIELTWVVHNFSVQEDMVFDHLNAPWGGTRVTSLPFRYVTAPDGRLLNREEILNDSGVTEVRKTAGWNLSCATESADSPSLALVYGRDKHLVAKKDSKKGNPSDVQTKNSLYRDWRARAPAYSKDWKDWSTRPENSFRNYDVVEVIPKIEIRPGEAIWYRSFLVVGPKDKVVRQSTGLVDHVDYGSLTFAAESAPKVNVRVDRQSIRTGIATVVDETAKEQGPVRKFQLYATPVAGASPLFLIEDSTTRQKVVTSDPYFFVPQKKLELNFPPDHPFSNYFGSVTGYSLSERKSNWERLLGFAAERKPAEGNWQRLSSLLGLKTFPEAGYFPEVSRFHRDLWVEVSADESTR